MYFGPGLPMPPSGPGNVLHVPFAVTVCCPCVQAVSVKNESEPSQPASTEQPHAEQPRVSETSLVVPTKWGEFGKPAGHDGCVPACAMHKLNPVGVVAHEPPLGHVPVGEEELAQTRPVAVYATGAVATEASASHSPGA